MDFVRIWHNIIDALFKEVLNKYFEDLFDSSECKFQIGSLHHGFLTCEKSDSSRGFVFLGVEMYGLNSGLNYARFKTYIIPEYVFYGDVKKLPQCFKEECEFVFWFIKSFEDKSDDYIKQELLNTFIHSFHLGNSYLDYELKMERKIKEEMDKLTGEVVF